MPPEQKEKALTATSVIDDVIQEHQLEAFGDFLIVRPHNPSGRRTRGGLALPDTAQRGKKEAVTGTVVAVGPGEIEKDHLGIARAAFARYPMDAKVGDVVIFNQWSGSEFELEVGGDKLLYISQKNVFGRVNS